MSRVCPRSLGDAPLIHSEDSPKSSKYQDISKGWLTAALKQPCERLRAQELCLPKCTEVLNMRVSNCLHIYAVGLRKRQKTKTDRILKSPIKAYTRKKYTKC